MWQCSHCGVEQTGGRGIACHACGHIVLVPLQLTSATGQTAWFRISTVVGRSVLKQLHDTDWRVASEEQFTLSHDSAAGGWVLRHVATAFNPTFVNGTPVAADGVLLASGSILTIGPVRMRLTARCDP
jgi:hypothetical protein